MKELNRDQIVSIIKQAQELKGAYSPSWEKVIEKRTAQLAEIDSGKKVVENEIKFTGFNRFGDASTRSF